MEETRRRMEEQERRLHAMIRLQQQQVASAGAVTGYGRSQGATAAELEALHNMTSSQKHLIDSLQLEKAQMVNAMQTERLAKQMVEREVTELKNCLQETERRIRLLEKELEEAKSRRNQPSEEEIAKLRALERDCIELEQALAAERRRQQRDFEERQVEIARVRKQMEEEAAENLRRAVQNERALLDDARTETELVRSRLAQAESDACMLRDRIHQLEMKLRETEERLSSFEQKYTQLDRDSTTIRNELRLAEEAKKSLEQLLERTREDNQSLRAGCQSLETALQTLRAEKLALETRIGAHEQRFEQNGNEIMDLRAQLENREQTIRELEEQAREDERMRRELHNMVQELKGNIRVFCRIRPLLSEERQSTTEGLFQPVARSCGRGLEVYAPVETKRSKPRNDRAPLAGANNHVPGASDRPQWVFQFDRVFDALSTQEQVFEEISQLVQSALDGYKVCIFAYGQTGSGKTFTMIGDHQHPGMIPLSVRQVFAHAAKLSEQGYVFSFQACFLEIYNEHIRDLLAKETVAGAESMEPSKFLIKVDRTTGSTYVSDVQMVTVHEPADVERLLVISARNRMTASTQMNERSSRSHSVFRLYIRGENPEMQQKIHGLLNLIDLAGSERLARSGSEGERLRETQHINKSLSALGDVIAALANKEKHVPFRNSKLTYLLQDSLGGDSKTLMFVNISPTLESFPESLCSLRFAAKVNACDIGTARRNQRVSFQDP
jgi:kinesin family protein C1